MRLFFSLLFILLLWNGSSLLAQKSQRTTVALDLSRGESTFVQSGTVPFDQKTPFFSFFIEWPTGDRAPAMRFSADGKRWTDWQAMLRDEHNDEKGITELQFGEPTYRYYQLRINSHGNRTQSAILHFYTPAEGVAAAVVSPTPVNEPLACPCAQPTVTLRSAWCPAGDCPENPSPTTTVVTHLIVHHSAGSNTSANWAAVVRSIWDYHVNGNGWSDIGYNYLVDPNGVVYEGRGNNILGAHFCGKNGNTMGVCVMGDFTNVAPTEDAITNLQRLLAWKACDSGVDPLGSAFHPSSGLNLKNISGHRDGCSTACPGDAFYPLLPTVRQGTANEIATNCSGLASPINLTATQLDASSYQLSWSHNSPDETGFRLEWIPPGSTAFEIRADLPANTLTFVEENLVLDEIYRYRILAYNEAEISTYSNVLEINTSVVGVDEQRIPATALRLSPNPASDLLQLELNGSWQGKLLVQILDLTQRTLLSEQSQKNGNRWTTQLDISALPAGTYLLRIDVGAYQGIWKVVKQ